MLSAIKFADFKFAKKEPRIHNLPIENIRPNPYQPRKYFDKLSLKELAASIAEYGVMQPISVRLINGCSYELVAGERRLRASRMAGLKTIPAVIVTVTDNDSGVLALIENLQRQNLNFIEEAEGYQNLIEDYGMTQEQLAAKLGKSQSAVANSLRILRLPAGMKKLMVENNLTERHARALLKIPDEQMQMKVLKQVIEQEMSVRNTEELVREALEQLANHKLSVLDCELEQKEKRSVTDLRLFTNTIKQSVAIMRKSGIRASLKIEEQETGYHIHIEIPFKK